jgi:hypothetical protein
MTMARTRFRKERKLERKRLLSEDVDRNNGMDFCRVAIS